jgi:hypothetical protein
MRNLVILFSPTYYTVRTAIRFAWVSALFGTCTVVSVNGTPVEEKKRAQFIFNKCPIYTHDGASAK